MARTTPSDVADIFNTDLDASSGGPLEAWLDIANELVDDIADADSSIDATRLTKIEKLLAAHLASTQDQRVERDSVADASATYQGETGMRINATVYGQQAAMLDPTGTLADQGKPKASIGVPDARDLED